MITAVIWLSLAFGLGLLVHLVGLPPLVGYLAAGFILSVNPTTCWRRSATPEMEAKLIAFRQLRKAGFAGHISATAPFSENIELLTEAGANVVYDYYDSVGIGLAKMSLETQSGPVANELAPDKSGLALSIPI